METMITQHRLPDWVFAEMRKKQDEIDAMLVRDAEQRLEEGNKPLGDRIDYSKMEQQALDVYLKQRADQGNVPLRRYNQTVREYREEVTKAAMRSLTNNVRVAELLSDRIIGKHIMGIDS